MKKILIISPNYQQDHCEEWIARTEEQPFCPHPLHLDYISPEQPISENVTLYDCLVIKEMLDGVCLDGYEGIILLHGTEYIPFTAAALSLLLTHLSIPLVIMTQNTLLAQKSHNRMECFAAAVSFIQTMHLPGVFVIIKHDQTHKIEIHFGSRISQTSPFNFQYIDILSGKYGDMIHNDFHFRQAAANPSVQTLLQRPLFRSPIKKATNVMYIRAYRRMPYHYYNFALQRPDAVLQELYDLPSIQQNEGFHALTSFSVHCRKYHTPLYLCPLVYENVDYEELLKPVLNNGAVLICGITSFSAYAKLVYGYGDGRIKQYLERDFALEKFSLNAEERDVQTK